MIDDLAHSPLVVLWCLVYNYFETSLSMVLTARRAVLWGVGWPWGFFLARHRKSSPQFVVAVPLCWICCHFKTLLRLLKCSKGQVVPSFYFLTVLSSVLFQTAVQFLEMCLDSTH